MKFLNFVSGQTVKLGLLKGQHVIDVALAADTLNIEAPIDYKSLVESGEHGLEQARHLLEQALTDAEYSMKLDAITYAPAALPPAKIICVGLNYRQHAIESGMAIPEEPVLFSKFDNAIAAPDQAIDITGLTQVDYESELAVVIGKTTKRVSEESALDHVFGYCNANDISEREMQFRSGQWLLGKSHDDFMPIGPYLVTRDEIPDPQQLSVKGWFNGELRQDSNTADMIFSVAECISYISAIMTLNPGDIIITGTPFGVILGMEEKNWMKAGDQYTVEIQSLGQLTNVMKTS